MTPLKRYNRVAPSPHKSVSKTTAASPSYSGKENHKRSLQASSESSLLDGKTKLRGKGSNRIDENGRPDSAPLQSQTRTKKHAGQTTGEVERCVCVGGGRGVKEGVEGVEGRGRQGERRRREGGGEREEQTVST